MIAPTRVWLNRTYAENVFFIDLLRTAPVEVYATHVDADSPVLAAADHGLLEPDGLSAEAYVEFALDFCDRHRIDVFLPGCTSSRSPGAAPSSPPSAPR
ncbi:hypothetical protein ACFQ0T_23130 [Kitasatospora gansuensis]